MENNVQYRQHHIRETDPEYMCGSGTAILYFKDKWVGFFLTESGYVSGSYWIDAFPWLEVSLCRIEHTYISPAEWVLSCWAQGSVCLSAQRAHAPVMAELGSIYGN